MPGVRQLDFIYIRQTDETFLSSIGIAAGQVNQVIGWLYRDTWVRTADGWRAIRQEKFFPDRPLIQDGKPVILPSAE